MDTSCPRARSWSAVHSVWVRASAEPRVPILIFTCPIIPGVGDGSKGIREREGSGARGRADEQEPVEGQHRGGEEADG